MNRLTFFGFFFCLIAIGCSSRVDYVYKIAGNNESELQKVLTYYEEQPLKLEAARFLIENMAHGYSHAPVMEKYKSIIMSYSEKMTSQDSVWLSLSKQDDSLSTIDRFIYDAEVITSDYLIKNIEESFKTWEESPWQEQISFSTFCQYILPYRVKMNLYKNCFL